MLVATLLLIGLQGCGSPPPPSFEIDGQEVAIQLVLRWWGADNYDRQEPHGPVRFVDPTCRIGAESTVLDGFEDSGICVGGVEVDGAVYISTRSQDRFSGTSLCHELLHTRIGDSGHRDIRWGSIDACRAFLVRQGPADVMGHRI